MHHSRQIRLVLLITSLLLASVAFAQAGDTYFQKADEFVSGVRCGTKTPTFEETQRVQNELDAWLRAGGRVSDKAVVNIPVAVHVVAHDDGYADVSDASIAAQMDVLNAAYQGTGFAFTLVSTDRTYNTKWSTHRYGSRNMTLMKQALAIDPATTYNLYFCDIGGGLLGYATFPDMYPEDSYLHGVVCLWASVPGGAAVPYDEGDTATHETGHFLGLYHTFQGGCPLPNDYCDDTAPEATAAYGCPIGLDTCTGGDVDPIHNFMDYTDDDCMDHFTADQTTRMNQQTALYRPTMYGGTAPAGPTAAFTGSPTGGDVPLTVSFSDASTGSPTSWNWTFGDGGTSTLQNPSHTYTAAGTYTVALTVANGDGSDTLTRNGYINVTEPGTGGGGMHVAAIDVYRVQSGRKYYGRADITIVDDGGAPVSGATVTAVYTGPLSGTRSGVTGTDGTVTLSSSTKTADATQFCFEVTGVTHADLDYDAAANVVTMACESGDMYRDGQLVSPVLALRNHPNPFNPMTTIEFELQRASAVTMRIFDAQGQVVATLVDGPKSSGVHQVTWDARDQASGIYFYQVKAGDVVETRKMALLK